MWIKLTLGVSDYPINDGIRSYFRLLMLKSRNYTVLNTKNVVLIPRLFYQLFTHVDPSNESDLFCYVHVK